MSELNLSDPATAGGSLNDKVHREMMQSTPALLDISTKGSGLDCIAIVNGRTWEAFSARGALIQHSQPEDDSLVLDELFTPGGEDFQFSSEEELAQILNLFKEDPQKIEDVARRGHERYLRDYAARPGWARLLM